MQPARTQIKMASRTGQLLRNLVRVGPRCSKAKLSSFSLISKINQSTSLHINRAFPTVLKINKRFYGGAADDESLEDKTMNVLKLFDKVDPSKVCISFHLLTLNKPIHDILRHCSVKA